jgi:hypothetical protein
MGSDFEIAQVVTLKLHGGYLYLLESSPLTESDTRQSHPPHSPFKGGGNNRLWFYKW